MHYKKVKIFTK